MCDCEGVMCNGGSLCVTSTAGCEIAQRVSHALCVVEQSTRFSQTGLSYTVNVTHHIQVLCQLSIINRISSGIYYMHIHVHQ